MVTESNAAPENNSAAASEGQEPTQPTIEELQARLDQEISARKSAEGRLKSIQRRDAIGGEALAEMEERLANSISTLVTRSLETDDPVERQRIKAEIEATRKAEAALAKRITDAMPRLDQLVEQSGKDFSDPIFAEASAAWEANRPEEAIALARIAVNEVKSGDTYSREEVDQMLAAVRKNDQAGARVDTGGSTASTASAQKPTTQAELFTYLRERRAAGNPVPAKEQAALVRGLRD